MEIFEKRYTEDYEDCIVWYNSKSKPQGKNDTIVTRKNQDQITTYARRYSYNQPYPHLVYRTIFLVM